MIDDFHQDLKDLNEELGQQVEELQEECNNWQKMYTEEREKYKLSIKLLNDKIEELEQFVKGQSDLF